MMTTGTFLPHRALAKVINEIARVDTPDGHSIIEVGYRGGKKFIRARRKAYLFCGACHHYSMASVCKRCQAELLSDVPLRWVRRFARQRSTHPLDRGVDPAVIAHVVIARFLKHTKRAASGCLEWQAKRDDDGYGKFWVFGQEIRAHRFVYSVTHSPTDELVCHTCDNPPCVEELHLFAGTVRDNSADMLAKGRALLGERSPVARLTEVQVRAIRKAAETETHKAVARRYGVARTNVDSIVARNTWRHIP